MAVCCCSVAKLCPTLRNPIDCSIQVSSVLHYIPEFSQIHFHWVGDLIYLTISVRSMYILLSPIYMYLFCFLNKKFYQGSKEETLELKWGDLYITVDFFSNWQCLGFKQNKVPVNVKLNHKDLRFLLYGDRELKFFYAINVHSESMSHALLSLRDRVFSCQTRSSRLLVETRCGARLLASR